MTRNYGFLLAFVLMAACAVSGCSSLDAVPGRSGEPPARVEVEAAPDGVKLAWSPVAEARGYTVFWGTEFGDFRGHTQASGTSLHITGLTKGERYFFAVTAWTERGETDYSKEVAFVHDDDPQRAERHLERGRELLAAGLYEEALAYLSAAIRLNGENAEAYKTRARLYEMSDMADPAKKDLETAAKLQRKKTVLLGFPARP